jgi:hypothetical protein
VTSVHTLTNDGNDLDLLTSSPRRGCRGAARAPRQGDCRRDGRDGRR